MYAVDANTGKMMWNCSFGFPMKSTPAVANGMVYTGGDDGNVYALNANTGSKVWQTSVGGVAVNPVSGVFNDPFSALLAMDNSRSSPRISGNTLYLGSLDGNLYALNANTGAVLWKYQTGGPILATPSISYDGIYVAASTPAPNGTFYKLDLSGKLIWQTTIPYVLNETTPSGNFLLAAPTIAPDLGMVFLRNGFRLNYGINATTGAIMWTYDGRYNAGTPGQTGGIMQLVSPLYEYGKIYINDFYGICCLNAATGEQVWYTYLSREDLAQGLAYSYSRIYSVNELGVVYVLDALTGNKTSFYQLGNSQMHSAPSLYGGNLYVGNQGWTLYCLADASVLYSAAQVEVPSSTPTPTPTVAPTPTPAQTATTVPTAAPTPTPVAIVQPTPVATSSPTPTPTQTASGSDTTLYIAIAAVVIIVVVAAAALLLRKRK